MNLLRIMWLAVGCWMGSTTVVAEEAAPMKLVVRETAGIRRFSFPVTASATFPEGRAGGTSSAVLRQEGRPVPVQLTVQDRWPDGSFKRAELDFNASPGPLGEQTFELSFSDQPAKPESSDTGGGIRIQEAADAFRFVQGERYFSVPKNLSRLLSGAGFAKEELVRRESPPTGLEGGIFVDGVSLASNDWQARVTKTGPIVASVDFTRTFGDAKRRARVEYTSPSSKSWIRISAELEAGPRSLVFRLPLVFNQRPLMFDMGAGTLVYGQLRDGTWVSLRQSARHPLWSVVTGSWRPMGKPAESAEGQAADQTYVTALPTSVPAEGWLHVLDRKVAVAVAVEEFQRRVGCSVSLFSDGTLAIYQTQPETASQPLRLAVYYHFVPTPVQIGAVTSPQAMLAPLEAKLELGP